MEDSNETKLAGLLEYNVGGFSSQGVPTSSTSDSSDASGKSKYAPMGAPAAAAAKSKFAPMGTPAAKPAPALASSAVPKPVQPPAPTMRRPSDSGPSRVNTTVVKGPHGIGLDISKGPDGRTVVQRFKELPAGAENPAMKCNPAIRPGDIIVAVNGAACGTFMECVKMIKGSNDSVQLTLERSV